MRSRTRSSRFQSSKLGGASEGVSRRGRNQGMKRWGREGRVARTWSTRRGADWRATSHDKGIQDTKSHRRPFVEDNGGVCSKRVTKVTQLITEHDARRRTTRGRLRRRLSHITCHRSPSPDGGSTSQHQYAGALLYSNSPMSAWLGKLVICGDDI